jgi:putative transcriptional regulator
MAKLTKQTLFTRDAPRSIGAELLASVREMKAGKIGCVHRIEAGPEGKATRRACRVRSDLSRA